MSLHNINNSKSEFLDSKFLTIHVQRRNGKKCMTIITGLEEDLDLNKIISHFKKTFNCNGSITKDEKSDEIIILTGDNKEAVYNFFINEGIYKKEKIVVKGI
jgi:translation initiation factor SUI1